MDQGAIESRLTELSALFLHKPSRDCITGCQNYGAALEEQRHPRSVSASKGSALGGCFFVLYKEIFFADVFFISM
jgi:hypothetical protein